MGQIYFENTREQFEEYGRIAKRSMIRNNGLLSLINIMINTLPERVTPTELMVFLQFIVNDIRKGTCGFNHDPQIIESFKEMQEKYKQNIDMILTWLPDCIELLTSEEFFKEFKPMYLEEFFDIRQVVTEDYGIVEVEPDYIDISNKNKADVLAALYNSIGPAGMGISQYDSAPMDRKLAQMVLDEMGTYFDYLKGRSLKISLEGDIIYVGSYNRNNGHGLAQRAIASCPNKKEIEKSTL